jgi:hypothetical protein
MFLHFYTNSLLLFAVIVVVIAMVEILVVLLLDAEKHVLEPFSQTLG